MISPWLIVLRLFIAALLGGIVGLERERLDRAAGLRTHALVCVGAALFMLVSAFGFGDALAYPHVVLDPSRIAAQVVSGIGFLGAGTIIVRRGGVRGLTTAASVWAVAAIGLSVGGGLYVAAVAATVLALVILAVVKPVEKRLNRRSRRSLSLLVSRQVVSLATVQTALASAGVPLTRVVVAAGPTPDEDRLDLYLGSVTEADVLALVERLRHLPGVQEVDAPLDAASPQAPPGDEE